MTYLWMLIGFMILTGIAALFVYTLKVSAGEGMLLAACTVMLCMLAGIGAGSVKAGAAAAAVIAAAGAVCAAVVRLKARIAGKKSADAADSTAAGSRADVMPAASQGTSCEARGGSSLFVRQPVWIILFILFLVALASFFHDFIQRVDEFHTWAAAVKYMVEYNRLPTAGDFSGAVAGNCYASSLFITFFQALTGYSEPHMYAASFLLIWTGLMLPFAVSKRDSWKKPALYCTVMYVAFYSLYTYGLKTLYVDMPAAAWAGGISGWWINRTHKKSDVFTAACALTAVAFMKPYVGPLLVVMVLLFMLGYSLLVERKVLEKKGARRAFCLTAALLVLAAVFISVFILLCAMKGWNIIPANLTVRFNTHGGSAEKIVRTFSALLSGMLGKPLASKSGLKVSFIMILAGAVLLFKISADLHRQRTLQVFGAVYSIFVSAGYMLVLYLSYIFMFTYNEGIRAASTVRYFSILAVYLLVIAFTCLLQPQSSAFNRRVLYIMLAVLMIFMYGLNSDFLSQYTGWDKRNVSNYTSIKTTKKQANAIKSLLEPDDRVYFLNQRVDSEIPQDVALYYLENQVSNYTNTFWKLTVNGGIYRRNEPVPNTVYDMPDVLAEGGYTYLWIYTADEYLTETLPEVFDGASDVADRQLYRVIYENGKAADLELCTD